MALCRTCYGETEFNDKDPRCSRCKSDLWAWREESQRGSQNELPSSIQNLLSLILDREAFTYPLSLLVFLVILAVIPFALLLGRSVGLLRVPVAVSLSIVAAFVLYSARYRLREARWLRQVKPNPGISLTHWQMGSFLLAIGLILTIATLERAWADEPLTLLHKVFFHVSVAVACVSLTFSWALTFICAYVGRLDERVPQPIFMDVNKLSDLALEAARQRLEVRAWEILAVQRLPDGGVKLSVREKPAKKSGSSGVTAASSTPRSSWTIVSDRWGRVRSILPNQPTVL